MSICELLCPWCCSSPSCAGYDCLYDVPEYTISLEDEIVPRPKKEKKPVPPGELGNTLKKLLEQYPYLKNREHHLHSLVDEAENLIVEAEHERAVDQFQRIEQECEQEEASLCAAFNLFLPEGADFLSEKEVKVMLQYLGFPNTPKDVEALINAVDQDGDRMVGLSEFQQYVGNMGGSFSLFKLRRKQMKTAHLTNAGGELDADELASMRVDLMAAGINEQAQNYWRVVIPESEFREITSLVRCQQQALRHIRSLAKSNHEVALPRLQQRIRDLGYEDPDLWMTLAYIREMAPVVVHINLDKMEHYLDKDTHYRNQFETRKSGGLLNTKVREQWEHDLFGGAYDGAKGSERCKYGVLNTMNDYRGVVKCIQYGDSYLVLKDVRLRCTFSPEDSANMKADRLAVLDYYAHVLEEYSDKELHETMKVARAEDAAVLGDSSLVGKMKYKETQIHGAVAYKQHVERLVAHERHRGVWGFGTGSSLERICKKHGWTFAWRDEEKKRLEDEEKHKLCAKQFHQRLQNLASKEVPDARDVPEGRCLKGCGRLVAPGTTKSKNAFKTCCRGCALGFGHDLTCTGGTASASVANFRASMKSMRASGMVRTPVAEGSPVQEDNSLRLCIHGCNRPVNPGETASGRPWRTCCRSCHKGAHDPWCGNPDVKQDNAPPGMCRMACGRKVAEGKDGRKFDTCCRGCALGKEHSAWCKAA